jgi:hypothetical protein
VCARPCSTRLDGAGRGPATCTGPDQLGSINAVPLAGGTPASLVTGQLSPEGVAIDASHVYWASSGDGPIKEAR